MFTEKSIGNNTNLSFPLPGQSPITLNYPV